MRVIATLLVRDEADVLPAHLAHHLTSGVSGYLATDNCSTDLTPHILAACPGLLVLYRQPGDDFRGDEWVSRMAGAALDYRPDWVVHLDADEFWSGLDSLALVPPDVQSVTCPCYDHPPSPGMVDGYFLPHMMSTALDRPTHWKVAHRPLAGVKVAMGNHHLEGQTSAPWPAVRIDHYPVRSYAQFARKAARGALVMKNSRQPFAVCSHWRLWGRAIERGRLHEVYGRLCAGAGVHDSTNGLLGG